MSYNAMLYCNNYKYVHADDHKVYKYVHSNVYIIIWKEQN